MSAATMSATTMKALQVGLSTLAGFVDAIGFLSLGGFYVAFMSGNSTLLGIGAGTWDPHRLELAAGLVAAFVVGVVLGTSLGGLVVRRRPVLVLLAVATLLAVAAGLDEGGFLMTASLVMAVGMGAVNTVFNRPGFSGVGLTYMTGTLVRIGQRVSDALGGAPWSAAVHDLLLWLGMVGGAVLGALAFRHLAVAGLWIGVGAAVVMAAVARWALPPPETKAEAKADGKPAAA